MEKAIQTLSENSVKLKDHQLEALKWLTNVESSVAPHSGIIGDEMGLGKTIQSISLILTTPGKKNLIVVPPTLAIQWAKEFKRFAPHLNISFDINGNYDVVITSYQKAVRRDSILDESWHRLIIDEGHIIRNAKGKTHQKMRQLKASHKWVLSGTPIQNSLKDINNLFGFLGIYGDDLGELVDSYVLRRTKKSVSMELPPIQVKTIKVDFATEKERNFYNHDSFGLKGKTWVIDNHLVRMLRLRQYTLCPRIVYDGLKKKKTKETLEEPELSCSKLDKVISSIQKNYIKEKMIVFCHFKKEMEYIKEKLEELDISAAIIDGSVKKPDRETIISSHKTYDILLINLMVGSVGYNLQMFNSIIFTAPHWNPTHERQAVGRCYRMGQKKAVMVRRFVMKDTIEERIVKKNKIKTKLALSMGF